MSFSVRQAARSGVRIDAESARAAAEGYLIDFVGDLFSAGSPTRSGDSSWVMPILFATASDGLLGQVGTICVDAQTGEVIFSQEDHAKVKARARELAGASSP